MPGPSRRTVLMGGIGLLVAGCGAGYELIQDGTLPGKYALARLDGACGSAPPPPRGALPAVHAVSFYSAYRHRQVQLVTLIPAGAAQAAGARGTWAFSSRSAPVQRPALLATASASNATPTLIAAAIYVAKPMSWTRSR